MKCVHEIPRSVSNRKQAKKDLQKLQEFSTDSDHDYIYDDIGHEEKVEHERTFSSKTMKHKFY